MRGRLDRNKGNQVEGAENERKEKDKKTEPAYLKSEPLPPRGGSSLSLLPPHPPPFLKYEINSTDETNSPAISTTWSTNEPLANSLSSSDFPPHADPPWFPERKGVKRDLLVCLLSALLGSWEGAGGGNEWSFGEEEMGEGRGQEGASALLSANKVKPPMSEKAVLAHALFLTFFFFFFFRFLVFTNTLNPPPPFPLARTSSAGYLHNRC